MGETIITESMRKRIREQVKAVAVTHDPHPSCWGVKRNSYDCFCGHPLTRKQRVDCYAAYARGNEAYNAIARWQALPWWRRLWEWLRW